MSLKPCKFFDIRSGSPVLIGDYEAALEWLVKNPDVMANPFISKVRKSFQSALDKLGLKANVEFISDKEAESIKNQQGIKFQFVGEKSNLEGNDRAALDKAKRLESEGWNSKDIFLQTGWERGSEGKWRMEIPDVQYKPEGPLLNALLSKNTKTYNFFDLFDFPELEQYYPDAKNIKVTIGGRYGEAAAAYDDKTKTIYLYPDKIQDFHKGKSNGRILEETRDLRGLRSVVAHELAHYVQEKEGWNKGGNPLEFQAEEDPVKEYRRLSGEQEANNVQERFRWPWFKRMTTPFSESEKLPRSEQRPKLMRNAQGEILGFVQPQPDGSYKVWIDPKTTDAETPIHELAGHIFMPLLKEAAPELHAKGIELIQNTPYLKAAEALGLEGDAASEEALAQAIGEKGKQLSESKRKGFIEWLNGMWQKVGEKLGISVPIKNLTLSEFTDLIAGSVLQGDKLKVSEAKPATKEAKSPTAKNYVEARDQIAEGANLTKEEIEDYLPSFLQSYGIGPNTKLKTTKPDVATLQQMVDEFFGTDPAEISDYDSGAEKKMAEKIAKWVESVQSESGIKPMSLADRIKAYTAAQRNELKGTATSGGVLYKALLDAIDLAVDAAVKAKATAKEINAAIKKAIEDFRTQYQTNQKADAEKAIAYLQKGAPTSVKKQIEGKNEPTKRQVQKAIDRAFAVGMGYGKIEGAEKGQKVGFKQGTADARTQIKNTISEALDNLETKLSSKQVQQILNAIPKIFTEATKEKFSNTVNNIIDDANYVDRVSKIAAKQAKAKGRDYGNQTNLVKNFLTLNPNAIPEKLLSDYEQALDGLIQKGVPAIKVMNAVYNDIMDAYDPKVVSRDELDNLVKQIATIEKGIKTLDDYLAFSKALTSLQTALDRLVAQGEITEKDAQDIREKYNKAEVSLRDGTPVNVKEEVGKLKERMIADAKQLTADVRLSGFTPLQKEVANKLMNIPLETLMDFTPQQLNLYQKAIIELDNGFINTTAYDLIKQAGLIDAAKRISEATKAVMDQKKINDQKNIIAKAINAVNGFAWKSVDKATAQLLLRSKDYWDDLFGTGLDKPVWNKILAPINNAIDQALHQTKVVSSDYYTKTRNLSDIQKTKLSLILIQQDYENNPVVVKGQSIDYKDLPVNEKDKYKYITQNLDKFARVSDKEKALAKKAYAKLPKDADGNLDTKKAIAALSPSEKVALEAIKGKIFDKLKDYVRINTEKRGDVFESRDEYTPNNVRQKSVIEDVSNAEFINEVLGTTASNAIRLKQAATNQRTGDRFYVSYDLDNIVLGHIRDTFRDFYLTDPVRTTLGSMSRLAAQSEANSDQQGMLIAMEEAIKESVITALDLNRENSKFLAMAMDKSMQRIRVLNLSTPRFVADFVSNMGRLAIENPQAYQRAVDVLIDKDNKYDKMMEQLFTAVSDFSSLHGGESITNAKGPIEKFTEKMIGLGDAGPMKVSAVTEFEKAFKKETGKDFNLDQFLNEDSEYADENAKAILKARDKAQAELYRQFVPQSTFAQAASTKLVPFLTGTKQLYSKKETVAKIFSFLQNYTVHESLKAGQALKDIALGTNEGRVMAARRLTSVIVSNTMYAVGMSMLAQAYKEIGDDDEEPWDEEVKNVLSAWTDDLGAMMAGNATSLLMGRYGSVMRTILPIIMGLVKVAGKDSEAEAYIDGLYKYMQEGLYTSAITTRDTGKKWLKLIPAIGKVAADIGEGELAVAQLYNDYLNNNESKAKDITQAYQLLITAFTLMVPNPVLPTFDKWIRGQKAKQFESEEKEKEAKKQIEAKLNPNKDVKKAFNEALESGNIEKAKKAFNKMTEKMPEGRAQGELADKFTEIKNQTPIQNHSDEVASVVYGLMDDATIMQGDTATTVRKLYSESELAFFKKKMDDFSKKQAKKVEVLDSIRGGSFFKEYFMPYNKKFGGELTETPVVKKEPSLTERTMKNLKMLFK